MISYITQQYIPLDLDDTIEGINHGGIINFSASKSNAKESDAKYSIL